MESNIPYSKNLDEVPEYPMLLVGKMAKKVEKRDGVEVINARIGIPDKEAPKVVKEVLAKYALKENSTYGYPCDVYPQRGIPELVEAIIQEYQKRYNVNLKPENIAVTSWTKPVLYYLANLFSQGNIAIPEPVYPVYVSASIVSSHKPRIIPTSKKTNWLPDFKFQKGDVAFYFCDPNNPTGSVADLNFYYSLLKEIKEKGVAGIFDKAYKDFVYDEKIKPVSITQIPELLNYGFEVVSFSKHFNFVGIGAGWIISAEENINRFLKFSGLFTQGVSWFIQKAALEALTNEGVKKEMKEYVEELRIRRDIFVGGLNKLGLKCNPPLATPYLWVKVPEGYDDKDFILNKLLDRAHVVFMPGSFFGESGKGYFRATLYLSQEKIKEALNRIEDIKDWS